MGIALVWLCRVAGRTIWLPIHVMEGAK